MASKSPSKAPLDYGKLMKSSYKNAKSYGVGFGGEKKAVSNAVTGKKSFFNSKGTAKNSFGKKSY